jgi:uncharacterized glyoxalase superfamily protein PhnB
VTRFATELSREANDMKTKSIPEGYTTITPFLIVNDAAGAIEFYRRAFGAEERYRIAAPGGKIAHAEIRIGHSILMLADEGNGCRSAGALGGSPVNFYVYVENVDRAHARAVSEGCRSQMSPQEMFWGDRVGEVEDPYGFKWTVATHTRDLTPEEIEKGGREWAEKMACGNRCCD